MNSKILWQLFLDRCSQEQMNLLKELLMKQKEIETAVLRYVRHNQPISATLRVDLLSIDRKITDIVTAVFASDSKI